MPIAFTIERSGRAFSARGSDGHLFFVGFETSYTDKSSHEHFNGLYNVPSSQLPKLVYDSAKARAAFGFWADFIGPTAKCEGGNFLTLNTYDRARFTWGFGQFGAHVPDGDFIGFFRDMLMRPEARDYFPDLEVIGGHINRWQGGASRQIESSQSTLPLMDYLNPTTAAVEDSEVIAAARLIHWTTAFPAAQDLQILHMIGAFKRLMSWADSRLNLDGRPADVCCVVCDILHQGRAKFASMQFALNSAKPLTELLKLGSIAYPDRIRTLTAQIKANTALLAAKNWQRASGDFI